MKPSVLLTLDSMRFPNTGLHTFGRSLAGEIQRQGVGAFELSAYVDAKQRGMLGSSVGYVTRRKLHRWVFPHRSTFNVVHFADQYCRLAPTKVRATTIMTVHDLNQIYEEPRGSPKLDRYLSRLRYKIASVDHVVAISRYVAGDLVCHFPESANKISVIYNGAEYLQAPVGHIPAFVPGAPFLFTVGMLCPKKNFHVLVHLLRGNDMKLVIAGIDKGDYRSVILSQALACGVADRVVITGTVSENDRSWYYENCEAFVFPSIAEGFGLPAIEAMHHGKPVFLAHRTALPEVGGPAAHYFHSFDPTHMQETLEQGLAKFTADRARKVREHASAFSWQKTAKAYLDLYESVL
jgi:glycosyltransferase involved in cell wall biosynthesis